MSDLKCNVTNCINNEKNLCIRSQISVNGPTAQKSCDTYCHSFNKRNEGIKNSVTGTPSAKKETSINCSAAQCSYNSDCCCTARQVEVGGIGACCCNETECTTFKKS